MLTLIYSARFQRDVKRCAKRRLDLKLLEGVIDTLRVPKPLPVANKDHVLAGSYKGYRECHIQPDWVLIYRVDANTLKLAATGTHADLFGR